MDTATEIALIKLSHKNMQDDITEIKTSLKDFIKGADDKYVLRKEFIVAIAVVGIIMPIIIFLVGKLRK